ncbi:hypothetical protein EKL29_21220 [Pantoea sp. YU22]|uniref:phage tail terminator protein n=1 Tax=Pantoea sp. YU22 TaxID=2497684 RepID=UPI000F89481B|nr:hypothetical protein [Pantoea sp. YU22]RTY53641.1 hypothetical protein EKL29_21220 [Pantoea sp. YU22]
MKLSLIIDALRQRAPSFGGRVAGAAEFQALGENSRLQLPAAYVVPTSDLPGEQESKTDYYQMLTENFAVIVALDNRRDPRGQEAIFDAVDSIRNELWRSLLGWEPTENHYPITYKGGEVLEMDRAVLYYQFDFSSDIEIQEADTWQERELNELQPLKSVWVDVDYIDPGDGPDGIIEHSSHIPITE